MVNYVECTNAAAPLAWQLRDEDLNAEVGYNQHVPRSAVRASDKLEMNAD